MKNLTDIRKVKRVSVVDARPEKKEVVGFKIEIPESEKQTRKKAFQFPRKGFILGVSLFLVLSFAFVFYLKNSLAPKIVSFEKKHSVSQEKPVDPQILSLEKEVGETSNLLNQEIDSNVNFQLPDLDYDTNF